MDAEARGLSQAAQYNLLFKRLLSFSEAHALVHLGDVTISTLRKFRAEQPHAGLTAQKELERMKSFFRFCHESGWIAINPAARLKPPAVDMPRRSPSLWWRMAVLSSWLAATEALFAHGADTHPDVPQALTIWSWDPLALVPLALSAAIYARGVRRAWRSAGVGRSVRVWQVGAFTAGWLVLLAALVSPVDVLSDLLLSAHMLQHELLMLVAAPLLALSAPAAAVAWAATPNQREWLVLAAHERGLRVFWRRLTHPLSVWILHAAVLWIWHLPALYEASLRSEWVHTVQHLCFFGSAALFWWSLAYGRHGRLGYGAAVLFVFTTSLHSSILGALMTFAPSVWYPSYAVQAQRWPLNPLEDQQLAGLLMWVPAGALLLVLGLGLFAAWLGEAERRLKHSLSPPLAASAARRSAELPRRMG